MVIDTDKIQNLLSEVGLAYHPDPPAPFDWRDAYQALKDAGQYYDNRDKVVNCLDSGYAGYYICYLYRLISWLTIGLEAALEKLETAEDKLLAEQYGEDK